MYIDISDSTTYPKEFELILERYFAKMPTKVVEKIRGTKVKYDKDVRCVIEDYVGIFKAEQLYKELEDVLNRYDIECFHSTKVLCEDDILHNGLKLNNWEWYIDTLINTLVKLGINVIDLQRIEGLVEHEYNRKYYGREQQICFYSGLSLIDNDGVAGYEQFCENIGGELARWALKMKEPDIYRLLKENGKAFIVKFIIPFSDIADFCNDRIIYQFISYIAAEYFWNFQYQIQFDGMITKNISQDKILELIPYTKEIDY